MHCLVDDLSQRIDDGRPLPELQPWFVRENKWRAARYGLDATIIVDAEGTQRPVADDIAAHLDRLEPVARRLGCAAELTSIGDIISSGGSSTRQRRIADEAHGDLTAVVAHLARELKER